jgi:adenosylmethionine-8-amino-7-oxononanoate aminotransferase
MVPLPDPRLFLTSGGSDSVEVAAKLARRYWHVLGRDSKKTIVTRELCYHGLHGFGTSLAGLEFNRTGQGELLANAARVPTNDAAGLERLVAERGADTIAAFYCEPIIGTGGIIHPADGYLEAVERICKQNEILFVVDEVITGFGRTGSMFASERFGLHPDIMLLAKGVTSGYLPLGAAVVAEQVWAPFWEEDSDVVFHHGITYSGHASACAAAMANIDILEREELVGRVQSLEGVMARTFKPFEAHDLVKEVRTGIGLLTGIQLHDPAIAEGVAERCLDAGVLMRTITGGTLHISPPFVITEEDVALLASTVGGALDEAAG